MLLKIFGCLLTSIGGAGIGISKAMKCKRREMELKELHRILSMIKMERELTRRPMEDVFESISQKCEQKYQTWLLKMTKELREKRNPEFKEIWIQNTTIFQKERLLSVDELEELKRLGAQLEYEACLEVYLYRLHSHIEEVEKEGQVKRKLYQSLGIMGGIFLSVLLL